MCKTRSKPSLYHQQHVRTLSQLWQGIEALTTTGAHRTQGYGDHVSVFPTNRLRDAYYCTKATSKACLYPLSRRLRQDPSNNNNNSRHLLTPSELRSVKVVPPALSSRPYNEHKRCVRKCTAAEGIHPFATIGTSLSWLFLSGPPPPARSARWTIKVKVPIRTVALVARATDLN